MSQACKALARRAAVVVPLFLITASPSQHAAGFSLQTSTLAVGGGRGGRGARSSARYGEVSLRNTWHCGATTRSPAAELWPLCSREPSHVEATRVDDVSGARNPMDPRGLSERRLLPAERDINDGVSRFNADLVSFLKDLMVRYYGERTYARFYALETIARVPYFGYLCVLHLYETLGQWRQADYLKVHFAESYNELHHLLIMEELGGNTLFWDRWFAQHVAVSYFFAVVFLYLANPRIAYNLNQHVEEHAFSTYDEYLSSHGEELKKQPAPEIAKKYYGTDMLYVFNGLHNDPDGPTFAERNSDRPVISNLFDTFVAVRNDEWEHVKTMKALQKDVSLAEKP